MSKTLSAGLALLLSSVTPAAAQGLETLGTRAAGLSAFVAVADDVSAAAWNPSGFVFGPFFNASLDLGRRSRLPDGAVEAPGTADRLATTLIAVGVPPLGLSYYRVGTLVLEGAGPEVRDPSRREANQAVGRSVTTTHLGATLLQSLGESFTVGATVKLVHGRVGAGLLTADGWKSGFDRLEAQPTFASTAGDVDLGAMFAARSMRAGLVVRNLTEPAFKAGADEGPEVTVPRHARAGLAWGDRWPGQARTIVAVDADLTRVGHASGDRRDVAAGVERWVRGQQVGVRAGLRASTVGAARTVVTGGLSYAVRPGTYADAFIARGQSDVRGWGIGLRLTY